VHAATQAHLASLGVPFTALRNGFYASTLEFSVGDALTTGRLVAPADGPVSWTAHADLAEAAAVALTSDGLLDGVSAPLTASRALDLEAVAALLAEVTGRPVERVVVGDAEWAAAAVAHGMPAPAAEFTLGLYRAARAGEFDVVDPTLEGLLGHRPTPVRAVLEGIAARG